MGQQGLPELWALVKHGAQLLGGQLQDDLEALGLGALAALDEALPHLGVLPHLDGKEEGGVREHASATLGTGGDRANVGPCWGSNPCHLTDFLWLHTAPTSSEGQTSSPSSPAGGQGDDVGRRNRPRLCCQHRLRPRLSCEHRLISFPQQPPGGTIRPAKQEAREMQGLLSKVPLVTRAEPHLTPVCVNLHLTSKPVVAAWPPAGWVQSEGSWIHHGVSENPDV